MKTQSMIAILCALGLVGCKPVHTAVIPGNWKDSSGFDKMTFAANGFYTSRITVFKRTSTDTGTWRMENGDLIMTPSTSGGRPIAIAKADLKALALRLHGSKPIPPNVTRIIDDMDKPYVMRISDDGRTMTTDKARDSHSGRPSTLTRLGD